MAIQDLKITSYGGKDVASAPDRLTGTAAQNKAVFDGAIKAIIEPRINALVEELMASGAAAQLGFTAEDFTADNVAAALLELYERSYNKVEVDKQISETAGGAQDALDELIAELFSKIISRDKGAPASIAGVDNAGNDIALLAGVGIRITPDKEGKTITITAMGEAAPAAHACEHEANGADALNANIAYDNAISGLASNTVQGAVDELADSKEPSIVMGTTAQYSRGDKTWQDFATAVRASALTGLSTATNAVITAADTILTAVGKLQAQITLRAPLASPALTGTPTAPTAAATVNSTQIATTAYVKAQLASPTFTGTPAAPTATAGTNTTQLATTIM